MIHALKVSKDWLSHIHAGKETGALWKKLSDKDKKKYDDLAAKDKKRYEEVTQEGLNSALGLVACPAAVTADWPLSLASPDTLDMPTRASSSEYMYPAACGCCPAAGVS